MKNPIKDMNDRLKKAKEERDMYTEQLRQLDIQEAEMRGERRGLLHGLGWDGLSDDEVSWVVNHLKKNGSFIFKPDINGIRLLIANGIIAKEKLQDNK